MLLLLLLGRWRGHLLLLLLLAGLHLHLTLLWWPCLHQHKARLLLLLHWWLLHWLLLHWLRLHRLLLHWLLLLLLLLLGLKASRLQQLQLLWPTTTTLLTPKSAQVSGRSPCIV